MVKNIKYAVLLAILVSLLQTEIAFGDTTTVTTYVTKVQEDRKSTRWTVTEWLRIKERMKEMDLWLAILSNPAKDKFKPELNLTYFTTKSGVVRANNLGQENQEIQTQGFSGRSQFWATNLISASTGIRTLNLDFGIEGGIHDSGAIKHSISEIPEAEMYARTNYYSANLRLFGKSIQDSSIVFKYGVFDSKNNLQLPYDYSSNSETFKTNAGLSSGSLLGAEVQIYLINSFGGEATYHKYNALTTAYGDRTTSGQYAEAMAFLEISILRISLGKFQESWSSKWSSIETKSIETGYLAGVKLQI